MFLNAAKTHAQAVARIVRSALTRTNSHKTPEHGIEKPTFVNQQIRGVDHSVAFAWAGSGEFDIEVVGDTNYQRNLHAIVNELMECLPQIRTTAMLIPAGNNSSDEDAIRVVIGTRTVGYLDCDHAPTFRHRLSQEGLSNATTSCNALIIGGHVKYDGTRAYYGVMLDLDLLENPDMPPATKSQFNRQPHT